MMNFLKTFRKDEDGAVTVDWVVLTAAVVGLAVAAFAAIDNSADTLLSNISNSVSGANSGLSTTLTESDGFTAAAE